MSSVQLAYIADEESTMKVKFTFLDADGDGDIPATLAWTLSTLDGTVVNSRTSVNVAVPAAETTITLSGDDLGILSAPADFDPNYVEWRILTIVGTDSGSSPITKSAQFAVRNLVKT